MGKTNTVLTEDETKVLKWCFKASSMQGHDFGLTEDVVALAYSNKFKKQQTGALLSSLVKKGCIFIYPEQFQDDGTPYHELNLTLPEGKEYIKREMTFEEYFKSLLYSTK